MNKAVFLDRDGTINKEVDFCHTKEDTMLLPGAVEGMRMLQEAGFFLIIVTNQSGIARGLFTEEEYLEYSKWFEKMLFERKVTITKTYYCPHLPEAAVEKYKAECNCRKPKIALFEQAIADNDISSENSWAIG
ncbi:MAG: HAD-IIIA family hydrolase, partial [Prevotella sp.]|nr:HAD-IIIA family hydrolase [Prevotella sp.]